ncbi:serine/threonine-protein kinase [Pontiellaceae bacterium B12219]|nr:serine/threonine-protein kinase [Pontiellaceae bacterium B12219]
MNSSGRYQPDHRLVSAYDEATSLDEEGLKGLCPSYIELTESITRYRDSELLGKGAVKEVYKTFNNHTKRWIAMARLRTDRGPEFYDLFVHEAWLTASLSHPNIITIHDAGVDEDGRPFFTMDLKGNSSLADRVTGPAAASRRELLEVFMKVCDAVAYAHSRGIVHLDLKPENIQADTFGEVLVCDWGLAKVAGEMEDGEHVLPSAFRPLDNMTLMGQIKGSLGYMAPEQVITGAAKDHRSDIFALGCILHLILTGHPPFEGSEDEILLATKNVDLIPPRTRYPDCHIPEALEAVVMKAMARLPEGRYATAQALRDEISNFLGGYSTLAEKSGFFREARLFLRRNRVAASITFLAIVTLSVVSVLFIQRINHQQERAAQFASEAESVTTLYLDELERSEQERKGLAFSLASSASDLKKLGIYVRPVETVREARKLIASAFALNSESTTAQMQNFSLDCISLNFKAALNNPLKPDSGLVDYLLFAKAFPEFDFTETKRPTVVQLTEFLLKAREINPNRKALMERMVAYDFAARLDKEGYAPVVEALLAYVNEKKGDLVLEHNVEESALVVRAGKNIRFVVWDKWGSNNCLLRFLPIRSFKPILDDRFYLGDLQDLQIESLDLTECESVIINHPVDLPLLRTLYILPGQIDTQTLYKSIRSNERFDIVEKAES